MVVVGVDFELIIIDLVFIVMLNRFVYLRLIIEVKVEYFVKKIFLWWGILKVMFGEIYFLVVLEKFYMIVFGELLN